MHVVFSTKARQRVITPDIQSRLWPYLGGIARENKMKALAVGGIEDHVHLLVTIPSTMAIAKAVQLLKGNASKWLNETFPQMGWCAWQEGYGAFSIGVSGVEDTVAYIQRQTEHHRTRTFQEEFVAFLKKHGIDYDETTLWD